MAKVANLENQGTEEKVKGRQDYDNTNLVAGNADAVNADGLLTIVPTDYSSRKNKPLKKDVFASEATYIRYQALVAGQRAEFQAQKAHELGAKADRIEKFGSESARKAATKLARAKTQMATLRKQLLDGGMEEAELDELIAKM